MTASASNDKSDQTPLKEHVMDNDTRRRFLAQMALSPEGCQHMLSRSVDAEEGDEGGVFDRLVELVDDPALKRVVERHRDDEVRHAKLFRACLDRLGLEKQAIPEELRIVPRITAAAVGAKGPSRPLQSKDDVVSTYALLRAIELRGVEQFPFIAEAFRATDPETADVYLQVTRDERGHVRYCERIGRHMTGDDTSWDAMVKSIAPLEERAFDAVSRDDLAYCVSRSWVDADLLETVER